MAEARKALVTILIGDDYRQSWERRMAPTWRAYAERHGYDLVVIDDYIDRGPRGRQRSPHWQKCLILEDETVRRYESAVWLDADVMINHHMAPCIVSATEPGRIGLVSSRETLYGPVGRDHLLFRLNAQVEKGAEIPAGCRDFYLRAGLSGAVDDYANTGVLVLRPREHAELLRHIYDTYEETPRTAKEETCLSHGIFNSGLAQTLDPRFNLTWLYQVIEYYPFLRLPEASANPMLAAMAVNAVWSNAWFLHFTAEGGRWYADLVVRNSSYFGAFRTVLAAMGGKP